MNARLWLFALLSGTSLCVGIATGWMLRGGSNRSASSSELEFPAVQNVSTFTTPATASFASSAADSPDRPVRLDSATPQQIVNRVFAAEASDMIDLLECIGAMTRMNDAEIRTAWNELNLRPVSGGFGNSLAALYLWSRMNQMGEPVELPKGWGAENYSAAIELETARRHLPELRRKLESGEALSPAERRALFTDAVRTDPLAAVKLWTRSTKPEDYIYDTKYFGEALANPATRDAIMAELRAWQRGGDLTQVTSAVAQQWISRDPESVEAWLQQPAQADIRDALLWEVANVRVLDDPAKAWEWSRSLGERERQHALGMSASQLANSDPDTGAKLISELKDSGERTVAIEHFARTLAASDFSKWEQWRSTLSESERQLANRSAFGLWANNDVEKAVEWLNTEPPGENRSSMVAALVNIYAARDPDNAAKWIQTIQEPDRRREAATAALMIIGTADLNAIRKILNAAGNE